MSIITLDFETFYCRKSYSLSKMTTEAYIRDPRFEVIGFAYKVDSSPAVWVSGDATEIKEALEALNIEDHYLLCQNTAFDGAILSWIYGIRPKYYLDTMSMARPITGLTVGCSLKELAKEYKLGEKGGEVLEANAMRRADFSGEALSRYGEYCKNDVELTHRLYNVLKASVPKKELFIIDLMIRMYCDPVLELDKGVLAQHYDSVRNVRSQILDKMADANISEAELMSNQRFAQLLQNLGVEPPMKISPATGKLTYAMSKADSEFKAMAEHEIPEVADLVRARLGVKSSIEESRTESFLSICERGKLPVPLAYYGAHTGRGAGWDKINLQNLPRGGKLRQAIIAPDGHQLIAVDSAQIEARTTAWLAGEEDLLTSFSNGEDIYSKFATSVYGYPVDKSKPVERFVGKTCILGLGYGMGKDRFQLALKTGRPPVNMTIDECKRVVDIYRNTYRNIVALWKSADKYLSTAADGGVYTFGVGVELTGDQEGITLPNGMKIRYPNLRKADDGYVYDMKRFRSTVPRKIYGAKVVENVVQALARNVVFEQMAKISQALRQNDQPNSHLRYAVVSTVHDEVIACVPTPAVDQWKEFMVSVMSSTPPWATGLPLSCEAASGDNYAECK